MEVTDAMEKHIRSHLKKLPRYDDQIQSITVTLDNGSAGEEVEVIAKCHNKVLVTNSRGHDLYAAIDEAFSRMERRISRLHKRLVEHHEVQRAAARQKAPE
jgi:ribosomal subunit interface protein